MLNELLFMFTVKALYFHSRYISSFPLMKIKNQFQQTSLSSHLSLLKNNPICSHTLDSKADDKDLS